MGEDSVPVCTADAVVASTAKALSEEGSENSPQSGDDSGHESNPSTPESPLTPAEDRASSPAEKSTNGEDALICSGESTFRVQIHAPGAEPFDLQVNSNEMVQELHQVLLERESTCHRTCFSLQLNGVSLDHFTELKNISGLREGSVLKVVEEPYTTREARIHIRHVRELIRSLDMTDAVNGAEGASLSYLSTVTLGDRKKYLDKSLECAPPEYVLPGHKERPLIPLFPNTNEPVVALKSLSISPFNPPPGPRKMKGDVLYLIVETREERRYHITCCTRGFYVNATTEAAFKPTPSSTHKAIYHSLIDLLSSISPAFRKALAIILKKRSEKHIFERLPTPYQVNTWVAPLFEQTEDGIRAEDCTQPHRIGLEDHIPGQIRDWNEELQTTHELPRETLTERLVRERAIFKIHSDFVSAAVKGAMAVVDGNVMAINPADEPRTHMFIWNNIFFSLGFDVKDHYKELGGDAAAHAATSNDLQGVRAYAQLDSPKLFTLGMVIVDYKGYRVTAQSIIPGILEREQEQSVVYGSVDFGKTVISSEEYHELLEKPAEQLKILPHEVMNGKEDGQIVKLYSSFETKGIIGNDSRHYILDLLRTFPPDVNYLEGAEVTEICKANGYPRPFPHKLASLRQEIIEAFVECRYLMFVRIAAYHVQQMRLGSSQNANETPCGGEEKPQEDEMGHELSDVEKKAIDDEAIVSQIKSEIVADVRQEEMSLPETEAAKKIVGETMENEEKKEEDGFDQEISKQIMAKAAMAVGSMRDDEFDMRFNPDCYCTTVQHAESEDLTKQRRLIAELAEFLLVQQIPNFVRDCLQHALMPVEGGSLSEAMHSRGINIRYLGKLTKCIQNVEQLQYLKAICLSELVCRSAKHIFRTYMQPVPAAHCGAAVSHFLNCFLGTCSAASTSNGDEAAASLNGVKKARSTKRRKQAGSVGKENDDWIHLSSKSLWTKICSETGSYYAFKINAENIDAYVTQNALQKTSILRRFAQMVGIQMLLRDYGLETIKRAQPFVEDDIQNLYCVSKHVDPKTMDAHSLFISGQAKVQQGALRSGFEMVAEALNLMNNVYGAMHPDMAQCMRLLARLSYILGDPTEALAQQHKAALMSERCNGLDNANTILEYLNLAHFSFANLHIVASLKLLYRARYLLMLVHGENHPLMAQIDGNIGVILYAVQEYDDALKFLQSALKLHQTYMEPRALKTALIYHLMARTYSCRGDFRTALQMEKVHFPVSIAQQ
ncbi:Clustered mitochondria -like protein [Toxocara canis]|uniref:Clustered mitochondria protein homolog n=1 Tax=Toxocara canis TaxID=6265 RepID=A0A0B2VRR7_TOXCA|nr:Clustered mitochondria -like protein [Toxocara canis]